MRRKFCRLRNPSPKPGKFAAQVIPGVEQEKRRSQHAQRMLQRTPHAATAASGIQESDTTPAATPLSTPNTVRTAKNISSAK